MSISARNSGNKICIPPGREYILPGILESTKISNGDASRTKIQQTKSKRFFLFRFSVAGLENVSRIEERKQS